MTAFSECDCCLLYIQNVTKGARNKILINVQKLQERASVLRQLEKVCLHLFMLASAVSQTVREVKSGPSQRLTR